MKRGDISRMAQDILERCAIENDYIEYKKSAIFKDKILKTACAYANNYMNRENGLIFIGVEEKNDPETGDKAIPVRPISGIAESQIEKTENELKSLLSHIHPRITYHLIPGVIDERHYIVLAVEPGNDGPYETDVRAEKDKAIGLKPGRYIRVRRDTRLPNKREEFELLKKFADYHFSSELNETATLDDLNYEYMKEYLVRTNAAQDLRAQSKLEMARSLGLISESEYGGYRAKNFAVLMFADRPADYIPYAYVELIREVVGTDKMESRTFDGPIWIQAQQVIRYFKDVIMSTYNVRDRVTNETHTVDNWPEIMFTEMAVNCILHKEYSRKQYIGIYWYDDRLTFVNHNRPLPPVTIKDMNEQTRFDDRNYLNSEIKVMFFALNLIQSYGSGIRRAKAAMEHNHSPALIFGPLEEDETDYTIVTALINEEFAAIREEERGKAQQNETIDNSQDPNRHGVGKDVGKDVGKEIDVRALILEYMAEKSSVTISELSIIIGVTTRTIEREIKSLREEGIIRREGGRRFGEWIICG